ncbi:MAG: serine hydrolase [Burkholderiales bacterium]|nr:beta-lactamase family protein [Burkholderiales bacterium]MDE1926219.1 serine hydrolase [Burkholderiales bacterium]MDE2157847.1 serine hydrolase [Burkholderiales bacterium]MDE2502829.1 serine hydrolase [Burkholderiales bacterium]
MTNPIDPTLLMQGCPPPPEYRVDLRNWQQYPQKIWSHQHVDELFGTRTMRRAGPVSELPAAPRALDHLIVDAAGHAPMDWPQMLRTTHTDAMLVLHRGRIVDERYFNGMTPARRHLMFSATKSMAGLMALTLVEEGRLDADALVGSLLPELAASAWAGATVRQVMDMTDGVEFSEVYTDETSDIFSYVAAVGWVPQMRDPAESKGILAMLPTLQRLQDEPRGSAFRYRSPATDVTAWLAMRAAGLSLTRWLEERLWSRLGMEQDAYMMLDPAGTEVSFAGMNATLRDLGRLGQLLLQRGLWQGERLLPASVADILARGGDPRAFQYGNFPTRAGWCYRSQWWVNPNAPRSYAASGAFGQMLYVFPDHELVIVKYGSHPNPVTAVVDPIHQRAFAVLIAELERG